MPQWPDGRTLVKALARASRWQRMLDDGVYTSVSEIGDTENISKSYVSRIRITIGRTKFAVVPVDPKWHAAC